jgi:hypothetical protein
LSSSGVSREQVPVGSGDAVVGRVLGFDGASAVGGEIPEPRAELEPALVITRGVSVAS